MQQVSLYLNIYLEPSNHEMNIQQLSLFVSPQNYYEEKQPS